MGEKPILFSGEMVRAILDGRKTQTRRIVKGTKCPYGKTNDRLWVRETHAIESNLRVLPANQYPPPFSDGRPTSWRHDAEIGDYWLQCHYRATDPRPELACEHEACGNDPCRRVWRPSIHMPRWASRIQLEITGLRMELLQDISDEDAKSEGIETPERPDDLGAYSIGFAVLWNQINGKKHPWASNPWVWVVEFAAQQGRQP